MQIKILSVSALNSKLGYNGLLLQGIEFGIPFIFLIENKLVCLLLYGKYMILALVNYGSTRLKPYILMVL